MHELEVNITSYCKIAILYSWAGQLLSATMSSSRMKDIKMTTTMKTSERMILVHLNVARSEEVGLHPGYNTHFTRK